jgi:cell division septation protein DedD
LDQPEAVAKSTSTAAAEQAELSSTVAAILEVDPVTRKVISPPHGTTVAWAINLMSLSTHAAADRLINKLKASGTATELVQINIGENTFYRVRVPDFSSVEEADAAHEKFKEEPIYQGSWVSRYHK